MAGDLVQQLLERVLESGISVDDVCSDHPELIDEVRRRWEDVRSVQAQVDAMFPSHPLAPAAGAAALPVIPGYTIERELGRGGMGIVYRASQERLHRPVAIKMLLLGELANERDLARFRREAELVAQLCHPNIVAVHDYGEAGGRPFLVMELMEGPSLAERLRHGPLPPADAARLCALLARAVEHAHRHGIVHRDLKPGNILTAADGTPKIADFGLAQRTEGAATISGARAGTPAYMAPEQAAGHASGVGPATDVHALGVVLYEMLVGRAPFQADSPARALRLVLEADAHGLRAIDRRIPRDLETICLLCLRKEPHKRYASAAQLADDLDRFVAGAPIRARRTGVFERAWLWSRRRPALAAAIAAATLLALALLVGAASLWIDRDHLLRTVADDLRTFEDHARRADWTAARTALHSAGARLDTRGPSDLRDRLASARTELDRAEALERVRYTTSFVLRENRIVRENDLRGDAAYASLCADLDIDGAAFDPAAAAARVQASAIRAALIAALDDWAPRSGSPARRSRLLATSRLVDPDPTGWRERVRDDATWNDRDLLQQLADTANAAAQPARLLVALADRLDAAGGDALPLTQRVLAVHPNDCWAYLAAGLLIGARHPADAVRYFQAAVALRPDLPVTHHMLGGVLAASGKLTEGEFHLRAAAAFGLDAYWTRMNLGICLLRQQRFAEARDEFNAFLAVEPGSARALTGLATATTGLKEPGALEHLRAAEALAPNDCGVHASLGAVLRSEGKLDAALRHCDRAVELDPRRAEAHFNRALVLRSLDRLDDALPALRRAIELEPGSGSQQAMLGQTLRDLGFMRESIATHHDSIRAQPTRAESHLDLGVTLAIDWQFDAACPVFERAIELAPGLASAHGGLTQALLVEGRFAEAVAAANRYAELAPAGDGSRRAGLMLRQAERLLAATADATPESPSLAMADRVAFANAAARRGDHMQALRWYDSVFTVLPSANDVRGGLRVRAAATALRAGGDARPRALVWLRDDLAFRSGFFAEADAENRRLLRDYGARLQSDAAFAAVRDAARLLELPAGERDEWLAYWRELDAFLRDTAGG